MRSADGRVRVSWGLALMILVGACTSGRTEPSGAGGDDVGTGPAGATGSTSASTGLAAIPSPRGYHVMLEMEDHKGVIALGGFDGPGCCLIEDAWTFELLTGWSEAPVGGLPPLNDAIYDSGSDVVVLLTPGESELTPDATGPPTFTLDTASGAIEQMGRGGPTGLVGVRGVYDAESDRVIAFGGLDVGAGGLSDDTWAYDVDRDQWTRMHPDHRPAARNFQAMAYDPVGDRVLMFSAHGHEDTWAYDFETDTWTELSPSTSPPARNYATMVFDRMRERMILFGGTTYPAEEPLGDTWAFDVRTDDWSEISSATAPTARGWHSMAYDADEDVIVLFGGGPAREAYNAETWIFDPRADAWAQASID